jgi:hypothetical protein
MTMRNRFSLLLTLMLLLLTTAPSLFAQSTWDGGGDGTSWNDGNNWDTNIVPPLGDNVIFNTTVTVTNIPAGSFVTDFTVSSGTVTLNDNLDIHGNLSVLAGAGFVGGTGTTITFNGTGAQNIGGAGTTTFRNLVIDNAGTSTTNGSGYSRTNPTNIQGSITVNGNMEIRRGAVAFCTATGATFNHNIAGNLVLGSSTSEVTIFPFPPSIVSNTEFVINHATNSNVTLTVDGNFLVQSGQGGVTAAMTSPTAIGGSSIFTVKGNVNAVDTLIFSMNGRVNGFVIGSVPNPITMNVGTAGGSGNFIMSNYGNVFLANSSGTTVPTLNLLGGTTSSPAIFDVKFAAVDSNFLILGTNGNGNTFINIDGVYRVAPGASLWVSDRGDVRTKINGRLIVPDNAEICGVNDGAATPAVPVLGFGPNGVLVVEDLQGLGDGTSFTQFAYCINRRTAQNNFNLSQIDTIGTIEYAATADTQIVTPRTYNVLRINRTTSNFVPPSTFNNPCVATGNITADTLQVLLGVFALTNGAGTFTHQVGTLELGSSNSLTIPSGTNTGLFVNKDDNATSTLTVTGNTTVLAGSVSLTLSALGTSITSTTLNLNGPLSTGSNTLWLSGHTSSSGSPTTNINLRGNVTLSSTSRFNASPTGFAIPTVTLGQASSTRTFNVQPISLLGLGTLSDQANVRCNWVIPANATVVLPSNSAIAVMGGFNLTVNGTLECQNGAALISTFTGGSSGNPTLQIGANGVLKVADVDGLGDGTLINGVDNTLPPNPAPLFFLQKVPGASPVPNDWDLSAINTAGTIEYNGTGQTVTPRNGSNNYFNLVFSGGNKTLGGNVDVTNTLVLNGGIISTSTNDLRLNNSSATSLTRTAGHINGRLVRAIGTTSDDYSYPIGDASVYRPITLTAQGSTSNAFLRGRLENSPGNTISSSYETPLVGVSQLRYYEFENRSNVASITVTQVKDMQVSSDDGALTPANTRVATFSQNLDTDWRDRGGSISSVPSLITSTSTFSNAIPAVTNNFWYAALGTTNLGDNPLPVELLSFTATSTAQGVRLMWETASEHESRGFTLLRKKEGESAWTEVASYQTDNALGSLNALNGASYSFTDKTPLEVGKSYDYQLRETGFDGQVATLETVTLTVRFNVAREYELAQNYPNPFNPVTMIRYQIPTAETVSLKVYDVLGKEVATLVSGRQEAGNYAVPFNASGLSSGVYFYRLQAGSFVETRKMMLVK